MPSPPCPQPPSLLPRRELGAGAGLQFIRGCGNWMEDLATPNPYEALWLADNSEAASTRGSGGSPPPMDKPGSYLQAKPDGPLTAASSPLTAASSPLTIPVMNTPSKAESPRRNASTCGMSPR